LEAERFGIQGACSFSAPPFGGFVLEVARRRRADFDQLVTGGGVEVEVVELLEIADALERGRSEGAFAIKGVEDDTFEEVAEGEVMVLGEGFQYFQDAFFHSDAGLDSLDVQFRCGDELALHGYLCTMVHGYLSTTRRSKRAQENHFGAVATGASDRARFSHDDD